MTFLKNAVLPAFFMIALGASGCRTAVVIAPGPHCADDPYEVCHDVQDWHGHWHHECRTEYHHHCWATIKSLGNPVGAVTLGKEFGVSFDASQKLIDMAVAANAGNAAPAFAMGLSTTDMAAIIKAELPSQDGINAVAKNLDANADSVRALFTAILDETRVNKAARK